MNARERVLAVLAGDTPDRVPVAPAATFATAHLAGVSVRAARADPRLMARCLLAGREKAGYDALYAGWESSFNLVAAALGCGLTDPAGDVPAVDRPLLAGERPDPSRVDPDRIDGDPGVALHAEVLHLLAGAAGKDHAILAYVPGPFTLAGLLLGSERFLLLCAENPGLVAAVTGRAAEACARYARTRAEAEILVVADPLASASVVGPRMFRRFAKEPLTRLMGFIAGELGRVPSLHICGQTTPILPDLVDTGARILELDHAVDLARAAAAVPSRVVLHGNVDPALLLAGPPAAVLAAARAALAACAGRPFLLGTGCEVALLTPLEHYQALTGATALA